MKAILKRVKKGEKFGRLIAVSNSYSKLHNGRKRICVDVVCICGNTNTVREDLLIRGKVRSCGCLAKEIEKKLNKRYGRLTVVSEPYRKYDFVGRAMYVDVVCDCGVKKYIKAISLKSGVTKSCGCLSVDTAISKGTTHGLSKHPLYEVWANMVSRCYYKKATCFKNYGGRGVRVCKEWRNDFKAFYDWAISKWKHGLQIDKDKLSPNQTGKLYSPKYCCFLTPAENAKYKRIKTGNK